MTLGEYVKKHGLQAKRDLQRRTGLRWQTIHEIAAGRVTPQIATAKKIAEATGYECTVFDLIGVDPATLAPTGTDDAA